MPMLPSPNNISVHSRNLPSPLLPLHLHLISSSFAYLRMFMSTYFNIAPVLHSSALSLWPEALLLRAMAFIAGSTRATRL
jgi:hypothetical protein